MAEEDKNVQKEQDNRSIRERMYDRIPLTVKQMDMVIGGLLAVLAVVVVLGLLNR